MNQKKDFSGIANLRETIALVVDGYEGYEALQNIMMMTGALALQAVETKRIFMEKVTALVPQDILEEYKLNNLEFFLAKIIEEHNLGGAVKERY